MKFFSRTPFFRMLWATMLGLGLSGCFEMSVVLGVRKDGSGVVHSRNYLDASLAKMMGDTSEDPIPTPTAEEADEMAAMLGEGVTVESVRKSENKAGWPGYEVVFAFSDINTLKLAPDAFAGKTKANKALKGSVPNEDSASGMVFQPEDKFVTFQMKDGALQVWVPEPNNSLGEVGQIVPGLGNGGESGEDEPTPFAKMASGDPEGQIALQMMSTMTKGARIGFFIQPIDAVAESNAKHRNGNLITILMADLTRLVEKPENFALMDEISKEPDEAKQMDAFGRIDGIDIDLQRPITVKFE